MSNKIKNLIIGAGVYFLPAMVMYDVYHSEMMATFWLVFGWAASIGVITYLDN